MNNTSPVPADLLQDSLTSGFDIGVMVCNEENLIEWLNPYLCNLLSVTNEELKGTPATTLLDIDPLLPTNSSFRLKVRNRDKQELWFACVQNKNTDKEQNDKIIRYFVDISDLQRREPLRLAVSAGYENSRLDPQSGVFNRKSIIQELNTQISRSRRYGNPLSVILVQHSLPASILGDEQKESLQAVAGCINSQLRWVDIIGSLSPGKFLIILPESDESAAAQAWKKINDEILDMTVHKGQLENEYQVSFSAWKQDNNADEMIQRLEGSLRQKVA